MNYNRLDQLGVMYNVKRHYTESDDQFRQRILQVIIDAPSAKPTWEYICDQIQTYTDCEILLTKWIPKAIPKLIIIPYGDYDKELLDSVLYNTKPVYIDHSIIGQEPELDNPIRFVDQLKAGWYNIKGWFK